MGKIITKKECNDIAGKTVFYIQSSNPNINTYTGYCPTYQDIIATSEFNINSSYQNNQLVQKSDISVVPKKPIEVYFTNLLNVTLQIGTTSLAYRLSPNDSIDLTVQPGGIIQFSPLEDVSEETIASDSVGVVIDRWETMYTGEVIQLLYSNLSSYGEFIECILEYL